jgi:hypothetical protein
VSKEYVYMEKVLTTATDSGLWTVDVGEIPRLNIPKFAHTKLDSQSIEFTKKIWNHLSEGTTRVAISTDLLNTLVVALCHGGADTVYRYSIQTDCLRRDCTRICNHPFTRCVYLIITTVCKLCCYFIVV